jgi:exopolysaccharide production protein ExoZ
MGAQQPSRIDVIQALRAVAALAVVGQHIPVISRGSWGVDLFFLISGFIVCHVTRSPDEHFLTKRLIRVVPLYWAGTALVFIAAAVAPSLMNSTSANPVHLLKSLLFIPFDKGNGVRPVLFLGWTLNYEMFFYAVFFVCMKISHRHRALLSSAVLGAIVLAGAQWGPFGVVPDFYTDPVVLEFVFGMACFYGHQAAQAHGKEATGRARIAWPLIALVLVYLYLSPAQDGLPTRSVVWGLPAVWIFVIALWGLGSTQLPNAITRLGDASYSLYLFHPYLILVLDKKLHLFAPTAAPVSAALASILAVGLCCGIAMGLYVFVEKPVTALLRHLFFSRRPNFRVTAQAAAG